MSPRDVPIEHAFSPDRLAAEGHAVIDLLVEHLARVQQDGDGPVMPPGTPAEMCARFPADFTDDGDNRLLHHIERALKASTKLHDPRFLGHQVATPLPAAALCDLVSSFLNNGMAIFEMGPAASAMERAVLAWMSRLAGFPSTAGGVLTSGGSLGNLTALLAARQAKTPGDAWRRGLRNGPQVCVLVAETAHYSVARSARILGLGDKGVISVDVDEHMRMKPAALEDAIAAARKKKKHPICVVASAGSTAAGAIDPIADVADICAREDLWLHIDGAHGASLLLSDAHKGKLAGIERADSIVWDAHKMMLMPALVTAVLFKDARQGAAAFLQEAGYLFSEDDGDEAWSDIGKRTVECTKRMMSLKLYACLKAMGTRPFSAHVDHCCSLATSLAHIARGRGLEVMVEPECNIVCFRPRNKSGGDIAALRKKLVDDGRFYIVQVHRPARGPHAGLWLRCTLGHPLTRLEDLEDLIDDVMKAC
jgi:L-2,4-diaminobutyrate decarboxylase